LLLVSAWIPAFAGIHRDRGNKTNAEKPKLDHNKCKFHVKSCQLEFTPNPFEMDILGKMIGNF
jgi:hypothetical protein